MTLTDCIATCESQFDDISAERKTALDQLSETIVSEIESEGYIDIITVCTHNSRRSQLAEIWLKVITVHYGLQNIYSYSGGTEATAFNERMVNALEKCGFDLLQYEKGDNPKYIAINDYLGYEQAMFSKVYSDEYNPQSEFLAIMVCDHADQNCPFVQGAKHRVSLPYIDPKVSDGLPEEATVYEAKVLEIGREMLYLGSKISSILVN